jgi:uncharacterized membrane protein
MLFQILTWFHILLMIAAVGANMSYAIWIQRAMANRDALPFTLRTIKLIDDWVALPAYGLLLLTGLGMVLADDQAFDTPWILLSLILWLGIILLGVLGYRPTLRSQIELAETGGSDSEEYKSMAWRGTMIGIVAAFLVLIIISLMVFKPELWG